MDLLEHLPDELVLKLNFAFLIVLELSLVLKNQIGKSELFFSLLCPL